MANHLSPAKCNMPDNPDITFKIDQSYLNHLPSNPDPLLSSSIQDGRESLGILSLDFQNATDFLNVTAGGEFAFPNFNCLENSDLGRESLGILQLDKLNLNLGDEIQNLSPVERSVSRLLDTGFLLTPKKYSNSEWLSFNSNSLDLPSAIYVSTKSDNSVLSPVRSLLNKAQIESRTRFLSQQLGSDLNLEKQFFWSTGRTTKNFFKNTYSCHLNFDDDKDDLFHDSVFIEGNFLAQKIADGSFLNDDAHEIGVLDCTPQPDWPDFDDNEINNKASPKPNTENIFKTINKMFPSSEQTETLKIKTSRSESSSSKSRDAKDILQNLSDIFNSSHRSEKQKSEGRVLINNLVQLLNNSHHSQDCEDSGHSSIPESPENNEISSSKMLSITKNLSSHSDSRGNENSHTSESGLMKKRLSQSMCPVKTVKKPVRSNSLTSVTNNKATSSSNVKNADKQNSNLGLKLKPKPVKAGIKKGPLIAVIPVDNMKKSSTSSPTTTENTQKRASLLQSAKTSTPINEPKLKPTATSTPCNNSKPAPSKSTPCNNSKLAPSKSTKPTRDNSLNNKNEVIKKPNTSNSRLRRPSLLKEPLNAGSKPIRRYSISEGVVDNLPRKRSNSFGKETGMMSALPKVRENLLKSSYYKNKSGILVENNSKRESNGEKQVSFSGIDKSGIPKENKENVHS